jgi:hypothetical protein
MKSDHVALRPALLFFLLLVALEFGSGALLYYWKIGFSAANVFEYYHGSEATLARYPERPDRFLEPRTLLGLTKIALGHLLAYGAATLALAHFARSLSGRPPRWLDWLSVVFFFAALLESGSSFPMRFADWPPWFRTGAFMMFQALGWFFIALVARLILRPAAHAVTPSLQTIAAGAAPVAEGGEP